MFYELRAGAHSVTVVKDNVVPLTIAKTAYWSFPPLPPGVTAYRILNSSNCTAFSTSSATATNTLYVCPFYIETPIQISKLAVSVATEEEDVVGYVGIYNSDANGYPNRLIVSGSFSGTTTGVKEIIVSPNVVLNVGWYWASCVIPNTGTLRMRCVAVGGANIIASADMQNLALAYSVSGQTTLPTVAPTSGYTAVTTAVVPAIGVEFTYPI